MKLKICLQQREYFLLFFFLAGLLQQFLAKYQADKAIILFFLKLHKLAGNYMFEINNRNIRTRCEICSKLAIKTQERRRTGVVIVNFGHITQMPPGKQLLRKVLSLH